MPGLVSDTTEAGEPTGFLSAHASQSWVSVACAQESPTVWECADQHAHCLTQASVQQWTRDTSPVRSLAVWPGPLMGSLRFQPRGQSGLGYQLMARRGQVLLPAPLLLAAFVFLQVACGGPRL